MLVSAGGRLIPQKEYIKHMWTLFYLQDITSRLQVPSNIFVIWVHQIMYFHTVFFNSLTEFIKNSSCNWPNKSCKSLPMPVINQILLPCTNLKFIFYKACIVVFRNSIEWAGVFFKLNLVILKSTGSNLRRSIEGWGEFIENPKWIKIRCKYLAFFAQQ